MTRRPWTAKELRYLRFYAGCVPDAAIAGTLRRSVSSIRHAKHVHRLGLKKGSPEWRANLSRRNKGRRLNSAGEFKPGNVPWITGTKGIRQSPATEFKKGNLSGAAARNLKGFGSVTIRTHKNAKTGRGTRTRWIKTVDRGWIPFARHLYERREGPLPEGYFVVHLDGDSLNDDPDNLIMMSRKYLLHWQRTIRPKMEARRNARNAKAQQRRWKACYALRSFTPTGQAEAAG